MGPKVNYPSHPIYNMTTSNCQYRVLYVVYLNICKDNLQDKIFCAQL